MKIKVKKLATVKGSDPEWKLRFTAELGEMEVKGVAINFIRNEEHSKKLKARTGILYNDFGVRLKFDNPGVRKHPEYREIRQKVVAGILEKTKNYESPFYNFGVGTGMVKLLPQLGNSGTKPSTAPVSPEGQK